MAMRLYRQTRAESLRADTWGAAASLLLPHGCRETSGVFKGYATMPWHTPLAPEAPVAG